MDTEQKTISVTLLSENDIRRIYAEELAKEFTKAMNLNVQKVVVRKTNLDMTEAIEYLNSIGYKCSQSLVSKLTMNEDIPFSKFGRRISFNADDLTKWVETKKSKTVDIAGNVSKSANSKIGRV